MSTLEELTGIEHRLSSGDLAVYDAVCADDAVFVMPGMVAGKQEAIDGLRQADPWDTYSLSDVRLRELGTGAVALLYRFHGVRGAMDYTADMISTYARDESGWRLVTHQQTPVAT